MTQPSFLARKTFGWPNYFWIAMGFALALAMVPRAAKEALNSNTNKAEDWLPSNYPESVDLRWFRRHFMSEGFVLVTWEGCTLGNQEKLSLLQQKLSRRIDKDPPAPQGEGLRARVTKRDGEWFRKILTGPGMIEELTEPPLSLSYAEAVRRLEGALVGMPKTDAAGNRLDDSTRTTCLVTYLSPEGYESNQSMRQVVDYIRDVAVRECGIPEPEFHMGGPTVDNVSIDRAGEASLSRLALLSGIVGLAICYWCFRNLPLTAVVVATGATSAVLSLAIVFYFGVIEVLAFDRWPPIYGKMDAVLMSMPAVVYVLGLSGAIHLVNYYRDARLKFGLHGAVERAVRLGWMPCALAALTTALGLGSLVTSDIVPIKKFGGFSAVAVLATITVLFTLLPVYLHRFPPSRIGRKKWDEMSGHDAGLPPWGTRFAHWVTGHYAIVSVVMLAIMVTLGLGTLRLESTVRLLKLLDEDSQLIRDYAWIEQNMAYLVPMEVVLTVPPEKRRSPEEHAEADGKQYRMTMVERMNMIRRVRGRIEALDGVSRTLSAATFAPAEARGATAAARRGEEYTTNKSLEESRERYVDYLQFERLPGGEPAPEGRELWRISARVTALQDIDYGQFTEELRHQVDPVLQSYFRRDRLVSLLYEADKQIAGARLCILHRGEADRVQPHPDSEEALLADLLAESGVDARVGDRQGGVIFFNAATLEADLTAEVRQQVIAALASQDAVLVVSEDAQPIAKQLQAEGVQLVDFTEEAELTLSAASPLPAEAGPRPVRSVYTGIIPLVFKTQRQLLVSLKESIIAATILIAAVMAVVFRSLLAGIVAMIPNVFPICVVFGILGWLDVKIDIGIMMTASVALGVAVDNTIHLVTWFRYAQSAGLDRRAATQMAYERCATAMVQTFFVGGLGLVVFSASTFTPTQQFGYMMITILLAALIGDLILLPALLAGPLGRFFERRIPTIKHDDAAKDPALALILDAVAHLPGVELPDQVDQGQNGNGQNGDRPQREKQPQPSGSSNGDRDRPGDAEPRTKGDTERRVDANDLISPAYSTLRDKLRSFRRPS